MNDLEKRIENVLMNLKPYEDAYILIKDLKFELDEAQVDLEIWKDTDKTSQLQIEELRRKLNFWELVDIKGEGC